MINVVFKNLEKSDLVKSATTDRIEAIVQEFRDLTRSRITVTVEMQNSPLQAGPDLFSVRAHIVGGRYDGIRLEKSASNFYAALADVVDRMLEKLNRFGDRSRVKERRKARKHTRVAFEEEAV